MHSRVPAPVMSPVCRDAVDAGPATSAPVLRMLPADTSPVVVKDAADTAQVDCNAATLASPHPRLPTSSRVFAVRASATCRLFAETSVAEIVPVDTLASVASPVLMEPDTDND